VVYDSVGTPTFEASLGSLRRRGLLVSYGQSSGETPTLTTNDLASAGSVFLTRPRLWDYVGEPGVLDEAAQDLFSLMTSGILRVDVGATWPLAEVARAHKELEARRTTGSVVLLP
jgi:NADPH2:quinone reductase